MVRGRKDRAPHRALHPMTSAKTPHPRSVLSELLGLPEMEQAMAVAEV